MNAKITVKHVDFIYMFKYKLAFLLKTYLHVITDRYGNSMQTLLIMDAINIPEMFQSNVIVKNKDAQTHTTALINEINLLSQKIPASC